MADDAIGSLRINVSADLADLQEELAKIPALLSDAMAGISGAGTVGGDAFEATAALFASTGEAAAAAAPEIKNAGEAVAVAGKEAEEAKPGFDHLKESVNETGEGLVGLLEKLGLAVTVFETVKESLGAFSQIQDITTSFTLLAGSEEKSKAAMEELTALSDKLAVSTGTLLSTAQRLAPQFGVGTKFMTDALTAAADAAAATGRDFETVSQAIERVALTGQVSARQLNALGISMGDIATTMGLTVEQASEDMKKGALDATTDVQVLIDTIERRFPGAAELIAQNVSGQFQELKNQLHELAVGIGTELEPLATDLIAFAKSDVVPFIHNLVVAFGSLPEPIRNTAIEIAALATALKVSGAIGLLESLAAVAGTTAAVLVSAAAGFAATVYTIKGTVDSVKDSIESLKNQFGGTKKLIDDMMGATSSAGGIFSQFGFKVDPNAAASTEQAAAATGDYTNKLVAAEAAKKALAQASADLNQIDQLYAQFLKATYVPAILDVASAESNVASTYATYQAAVLALADTRSKIAAGNTSLHAQEQQEAQDVIAAANAYTQAGKDLTLSKTTQATVTRDLDSAEAAIAQATKSSYIPAILDHQTALDNIAAAERGQTDAIQAVRDAEQELQEAYAAATKDANGNIVASDAIKASEDGLAKTKVDLVAAEARLTQARKDATSSANTLAQITKDIDAAEKSAIQTKRLLAPAQTDVNAAVNDYMTALKSVSDASDIEAAAAVNLGNAWKTADPQKIADAEKNLRAAHEGVTVATTSLSAAQQVLTRDFSVTSDALDELKRHTEDYTDAQNRMVVELSSLGVPSLEALTMAANKSRDAYNDLVNSGVLNYTQALEASIKPQQDAINAATQMGQDTTDLRIKLDETTSALDRQSKGWYEVWVALNQVVTSDIDKTFGDILFNIGQVGTDLKKLGEDIVNTILNGIIKQALTPLIQEMDKLIVEGVQWLASLVGLVIPGLGGILGAGPQVAATTANTAALTANTAALGALSASMGGSAVAGAAGDVGGAVSGAGGAGGGIGGAIGAGLAPIMGIITGAITAVTGVISVFQNMHQETSLNAIELNTRLTAIAMEGAWQSGDHETIYFWTKLIEMHTHEMRDFNWTVLKPSLDIVSQYLSNISNLVNNLPQTLSNVFAFNITGTVNLDGQELFQSFVTFLAQSGQKIPQS